MALGDARGSELEADLNRKRQIRGHFLRRAILTTISTRALSTVILLCLTPLLAHNLGVEGYGVLVTLTTTAAVFGIADLGVASGVISRIATVGWESQETKSLLSAATGLLVAASAISATAAIGLAWVLPWPRWLNAPSVSASDLRLSALFALLGAALSLTSGLGQKLDLARQRGHTVAAWGAAASVAGPVGGLLSAWAGLGLPAVVAATALTPPLVLGYQSFLVLRRLTPDLRPDPRSATKEEVFDCLRSGSAFLGLGVVVAVAFQIDTIIVSSLLGAAAAAQFSIVVRLFGLVGLSIQASLNQLWAAFAEALKRGDVTWVKRALIRSVVLSGACMIIVNVILVLFGQRIIRIWLGPTFAPTFGLLLAAAIWSAYSTANHPLAMFLNGSRIVTAQLMAAVPMAVLNIGLSLYLTNRIGAGGPLFASLTAHILCVGIPMWTLVLRRLHRLELAAPASSAAMRSSSGYHPVTKYD